MGDLAGESVLWLSFIMQARKAVLTHKRKRWLPPFVMLGVSMVE